MKTTTLVIAATILLQLLLCSTLAFAISGHTGWWWEGADKSGTGVSIEDQGERIYLAWYGYDETGRPVWYSSLAAGDEEFTGTLVRYTGWSLDGNLPGQGYQGEAVGSLTVSFPGPDAASLAYTVAGANYAKTLSRYWTGAADTRDIHGWWWDTDYQGMGIFMEAGG